MKQTSLMDKGDPQNKAENAKLQFALPQLHLTELVSAFFAAQASPACPGDKVLLQLIMVAEPEKNQLPVPLDSSK